MCVEENVQRERESQLMRNQRWLILVVLLFLVGQVELKVSLLLPLLSLTFTITFHIIALESYATGQVRFKIIISREIKYVAKHILHHSRQ